MSLIATHSVTSGHSVLETKVFKYNFLNFYITKTMLCILLKIVQLTLNK